MYRLAESVIGLAAPKPPSQVYVGIAISILNSSSGSTFVSRPLRARDRVTMAVAGTAQGRVRAGVGSVSQGAGTEPNSPDRLVRHTLRFGSESISVTVNSVKLLTDLGKIEQTAEAKM